MCSAQVAQSDHTAGLNLPGWRVTSVEPLAGYRLAVTFADGLSGEVEMDALILRKDAGVFAMLRDAEAFGAVTIRHGAVSWPGDIDLAPDALHAAIRLDGRCILS